MTINKSMSRKSFFIRMELTLILEKSPFKLSTIRRIIPRLHTRIFIVFREAEELLNPARPRFVLKTMLHAPLYIKGTRKPATINADSLKINGRINQTIEKINGRPMNRTG